jgi:hypothetical protein
MLLGLIDFDISLLEVICFIKLCVISKYVLHLTFIRKIKHASVLIVLLSF